MPSVTRARILKLGYFFLIWGGRGAILFLVRRGGGTVRAPLKYAREYCWGGGGGLGRANTTSERNNQGPDRTVRPICRRIYGPTCTESLMANGRCEIEGRFCFFRGKNHFFNLKICGISFLLLYIFFLKCWYFIVLINVYNVLLHIFININLSYNFINI